MKPGYKTTEFWIALLVSLGGLVVVLVQAFQPEQTDQVVTFWAGVVETAKAVLPLLLPLVLGNQYITARAALKIHGRGQ